MPEDAQDPVKLHVRFLDVKKRAKFFVNPTDKLKAKLDEFFIHIGSNQRTCDVVPTKKKRTRDVIVNVPTIDLGKDKEEDFWKTVYFPQLLGDDSNLAHMLSVMVENNALHLYV